MLNLTQLRILLMVIGLSLASMSGYFSVAGLAHLFGNGIEIWFMAGFLEVAKISSVSFLSNDISKSIPSTIKKYVLGSTIILMLITSIGVYGYLSSKYQLIDSKLQESEIQIQKLKVNESNYQLNIVDKQKENDNYNQRINNLQGLQNSGNNVTTKYITDKNYGRMLGSLNKTNSKYNNQIQELNQLITQNTKTIQVNKDSIQSVTSQLTNLNLKVNSNSDVSSLKFISNLTGIGFNYIINILILILVLVFDPLAISLLISANYLKEDKKLFGKLSDYTYI